MGTKLDVVMAGPSGFYRKPAKAVAKASLESMMLHDSAYAQRAVESGKATKSEYKAYASRYKKAFNAEVKKIDRLFYGHPKAGKADGFYKGVQNCTGS